MHHLSRGLFLLLISASASAQCQLPVPTNLKLKNQTSCSIDVSWKAVNGASWYVVEYRAAGSATWIFTAPLFTTAATLTGLTGNTTYEVAVASYCSDSTSAGFSAALTKATQKCTAPANISVQNITESQATVTWTGLCGSNLFTLQYRPDGTSTWTKVKNINGFSTVLSGLSPATTYEYRLQTDCGTLNSSWTQIFEFTTENVAGTIPGKNIVLILLDDGRYDAYIPNGGPSWFNTPAINRIANEGVNFRIAIPTTSQCSPSRACIYTGLYPHVSDVTKNGDTLNSSLPVVQQILRDNGYYTGFVGKYGQFLGDPKGFDWWATSETDEYENPPYVINGVDTTLSGHILDVYPQLALAFLNSVPAGQKFALFYFTRAPHHPTIPRPEDDSLFAGETIPFPKNFKFYQENYPSFYSDHKWQADSAALLNFKLDVFQTLKATDDNTDTIVDWLETHGYLDSTFLMFTSDNGYLIGEHKMEEKILALEESVRVPMFIRYPAWFLPGTVIDNQIASNIDIPATFLDLAGIENTYGFQGIPLRDLANGTTPRQSFLYESGYDPFTAKLRAVRTLTGKFIRSYCKTTTEEYYDLVNDPGEDVNEIFNGSYAALIDSYRILLDSLRDVYGDITPTKKICSLITDGPRMALYENEESPSFEFALAPNPASDFFSVYFSTVSRSPAYLKVFDVQGRLLIERRFDTPYQLEAEIPCSHLPSGMYQVIMEQEERRLPLRLLINH